MRAGNEPIVAERHDARLLLQEISGYANRAAVDDSPNCQTDPAANTVARKNGKSMRSPLRSAASAKYTAINGPMARPRPQYR
jgi:hypothetical protein